MKKETFRKLIREVIEEVSQERRKSNMIKKIQAYASWALKHWELNSLRGKSPKEIITALQRIIMELDNLAREYEVELTDDEIKIMRVIQGYAYWGTNNITQSPNKVVNVLQRISREADELVKADEQRLQLLPSSEQPVRAVKYEDPSSGEQQEVLAMKRIQNLAHWGYQHARTHPIDEVIGMFKKIVDEIDGLVEAHKKGKEVSPSNVHEVAPPGWEGTVKAMKKHSVGGAKRWNPKKKKDEKVDVEEAKKKKITNPYALAWWMKNQGYESHK